MRRRRRGGRAIDPRLSRVTKGPGNPRGSPGWVLGLINAHIPASPEREAGQRSFACISSGITTVIRVTCGAIKGTITDLMSHSQFHCTVRVHLDLHGLIFETSICYWQDQPGCHKPEPEEGGQNGGRPNGRTESLPLFSPKLRRGRCREKAPLSGITWKCLSTGGPRALARKQGPPTWRPEESGTLSRPTGVWYRADWV